VVTHFYWIELDRIADWIAIAGPFSNYAEAADHRSCLDPSHKYKIVLYPINHAVSVDSAMHLQLWFGDSGQCSN
jgi:hypothetical protein